jgi:hypothetical protein
MAKPAPGKSRAKVVTNPKTGRKRKVSYGQAGVTPKPGTKKGDAYCARSAGIAKKMKNKGPNTPNALSRKRWRCKGKKSTR